MPCIQSAHATHQLVNSCCTTFCGCDSRAAFFGNPYCPCNNLDNPAPVQDTCLEDELCDYLAGPSGIVGTFPGSTGFYAALNNSIRSFTTGCTLCAGQTATLTALGTTGPLVLVGTVTPGNPSTILDGAALTSPGVYKINIIGESNPTFPCAISTLV